MTDRQGDRVLEAVMGERYLSASEGGQDRRDVRFANP